MYVPYMFSSVIRRIKELAMWFNRPLALGLVVGLLSASPALAETADVKAQDITAKDSGTAVIRGSNGFVLFEHGAWPAASSGLAAQSRELPKSAQRSPIRKTGRTLVNQNVWRRTIYLPQVLAAEARFSLPPGLLDALVWTESRYNPLAISSAGAAGLGQLMPHTAKTLGVANRLEPSTSILGAALYLRQMLDRFGMVHLAVAAYNAGPRAVERAGGIPRNGETPGYVREVLRNWRF
jgi:hypothetical protein